MKLWLPVVLIFLLLSSVAAKPIDEMLAGIDDKPISKLLCNGVNEGDLCNMPRLFEGDLSGLCCSGLCIPEVSSCGETTNKGEDFILQKVYEYSCKGNEDGTNCRIPDYFTQIASVSDGICCNQKCRLDVVECPPSQGSDDSADTLTMGHQLPDLLIVAIVIAICMVLLLLVWYATRRKKSEAIDSNSELQQLRNQKTELDNMIRMAKKKYHSREIDEESFREIVRDKEKQLIEVETRMEEITQSTQSRQ